MAEADVLKVRNLEDEDISLSKVECFKRKDYVDMQPNKLECL